LRETVGHFLSQDIIVDRPQLLADLRLDVPVEGPLPAGPPPSGEGRARRGVLLPSGATTLCGLVSAHMPARVPSAIFPLHQIMDGILVCSCPIGTFLDRLSLLMMADAA